MNLFMRVMLAAYDERVTTKMIPLFLSSLFGKNPGELVEAAVERVDIDVIRDTRRHAVDVKRGGGAGNVNDTNIFSTHEYKPPLYWEETPLTANMLLKRLPGMDPFQTLDQAASIAYHATSIQREQSMKILREIERMAAEALQTGTITLVNTESLDFGKRAAHAVVPAVKWDQAGSNPITDIEQLSDVIFQNGKMRPNTLIFGSAAWDAFIANAATIAYLNTRYIEPGRLAPEEILQGAKMWGRVTIKSYAFDVYIYDDFFNNALGAAVPYITTDTVIVMNRNAWLTKAFAAVELLPQYRQEYAERGLPRAPEFAIGRIIPFAYERAPNALLVGVQSAPLVIPTAIDTIGTLDNVDT